MNTKKQIQQYLRRKKMRPYILANAAKVAKSSLYLYLKGEMGITLKTAEKLQNYIRKHP